MKRINTNPLLLVLFIAATLAVQAQEEKPELTLTISYVSTENNIPYLRLHTQLRKEKTIEAVRDVPIKVYLDEESESGFIGQVTTNDKGLARLVLPPSLRETWTSSPKHTFIATIGEARLWTASSNELEITKGRIRIDTVVEDGARNITASFEEFDGSAWLPAGDVELKIGVRRQGGVLPISDEESYTTDSTGMVTAEFKRDSLPGDKKGALVIVARTEDHELYGSVLAETTVPWGTTLNTRNEEFGKRTLWASRDKVPLWLLFMALAIMAGVWSVIVYLVFQIAELRKLGRQAEREQKMKASELTIVHDPEEIEPNLMK